MKDYSLHGKVALVTGGSRGIGREIALHLAQIGARIVVCSRKMESLQIVADEIEAGGGEALAIQAHVGRPEEVTALGRRQWRSSVGWTWPGWLSSWHRPSPITSPERYSWWTVGRHHLVPWGEWLDNAMFQVRRVE